MKEKQRLDKENEELDKWIEKRERMNKWLDEVTEALNQGASVPDQPEDPEIVYPGYREDNDTSKDATGTAEEVQTPSPHGQSHFRQPRELCIRPHCSGRGRGPTGRSG